MAIKRFRELTYICFLLARFSFNDIFTFIITFRIFWFISRCHYWCLRPASMLLTKLDLWNRILMRLCKAELESQYLKRLTSMGFFKFLHRNDKIRAIVFIGKSFSAKQHWQIVHFVLIPKDSAKSLRTEFKIPVEIDVAAATLVHPTRIAQFRIILT